MSTATPKPYWNPYVGGAALGLLLFATFVISGHGLGASGGVGRVVVAVEDVFAPTHVDETPYLAKLAGGDRDPFDSWLPWAFVGILLGGALSGTIGRRMARVTNRGPNISVKFRWAMAGTGGVLMGYGARLARGCTSGQGLSGGSVGALGSWVFLFAVFAGGFALAYFVRRLWR